MADYTDSLGNVQTAIETLSGGNWTPTEAPVPSGLGSGFHQRNVLTSVTCTAAGSCVAVGSYSPAQGDRAPLIETLAGGNWTPVEPGLPSNAAPSNGFGQLDVVTCPTISACVALGWYDDALGDNHGVMEMESGSTWSPVEQVLPTSPAPRSSSNPDEGIGSAVCPAAGSCVAVGSYFDKRAKDKSIIETLAGGTWSTIKAPLPTKADGNQPSELPALSCTADGSCVAVGSVGGQALTETLPGGQTAPSVTNSDEATFTVDAFGSFTLTATGNPVPAITKRGKLPKGLHFTSGRGTATISGTPLGAPGNYSVIIDADNGVLPTASQDLTLTITS
jgi:hypothetical protein